MYNVFLFMPDLSHTHRCLKALSQTYTHTNQEGQQVKGYKARARAKEKSHSKRAEGSRKGIADWIKNKVKAQIAEEERLKGNCFLATGSEGLNTKRRPERLKEYWHKDRFMCACVCQRYSETESGVFVFWGRHCVRVSKRREHCVLWDRAETGTVC